MQKRSNNLKDLLQTSSSNLIHLLVEACYFNLRNGLIANLKKIIMESPGLKAFYENVKLEKSMPFEYSIRLRKETLNHDDANFDAAYSEFQTLIINIKSIKALYDQYNANRVEIKGLEKQITSVFSSEPKETEENNGEYKLFEEMYLEPSNDSMEKPLSKPDKFETLSSEDFMRSMGKYFNPNNFSLDQKYVRFNEELQAVFPAVAAINKHSYCALNTENLQKIIKFSKFAQAVPSPGMKILAVSLVVLGIAGLAFSMMSIFGIPAFIASLPAIGSQLAAVVTAISKLSLASKIISGLSCLLVCFLGSAIITKKLFNPPNTELTIATKLFKNICDESKKESADSPLLDPRSIKNNGLS